ncbi:DUF1990 family protein [Deinococcus marmoris]|uniref:DUF1990 family protein n=1 Tax=Deinococcus marmoris TaxID=249408 RepID=UPI0004955A1B|nr:DUF1990 family protein [Deinococcus marmoris]
MSYRFPLLLALPVLAAAVVLKGPSDPLRPSTPQDGVGPLTRRRYWVEIEGSTHPAERIAEHWRNHLPQHAPKWLTWFRGLDHPVPPVRQGDRLWILMFLIRRGRVIIEHVDPLGFRARTLRLHPEAGTTDFRVYPGAQTGGMILQIESLLRSSSHFDRLAYLLGIHAVQRQNWHLTLTSVARYAGGRVVDRGTESLETPRLEHTYHLPEQPSEA